MSRLFLRATLNRLRSPRGGVELIDDDKIVPALAIEYCTSLMARASSGKAKRRLFQGRGFLSAFLISRLWLRGMCRSTCSNLFEENLSFGMNDQLL